MKKINIPANVGTHLPSTLSKWNCLIFTETTISSSTYLSIMLLHRKAILLTIRLTNDWTYPGGASNSSLERATKINEKNYTHTCWIV